MNTRKNEKPWHKNAGNLLIVNSILAAISVLDIGLLSQDSIINKKINDPAFSIALISGFISLFLFIATTEKIPEAVEEDDVRKHIAYMLPYNFGVLGLITSFAFGQIMRLISTLWIGLVVGGVGSFLVWLPIWFGDVYWLLSSKQEEFNRHISQLEGKQLPKRKLKPKLEWGNMRFSYTRIRYEISSRGRLYSYSTINNSGCWRFCNYANTKRY